MTSSGDGQDNSNDPLDNNSNVIPLKVPKKTSRKKTIRQTKQNKPPPPTPQTPHAPLINLPVYTKYLLALIIGVQVIVIFLLTESQTHWVFIHLGFIPGRFTGDALFEPLALLTPFTHMFIHGSWLHIAMNAIMLLAFGSGVERWIGGRKMIAFFIICGLFGVLTHALLNYGSIQPVIGASGGLSGLFALALTMMNRQNTGMTGKYGMWPFILLWIGISVLFGLMGSPDGSDIAWAAHVGGFLGGFVLVKLMKI